MFKIRKVLDCRVASLLAMTKRAGMTIFPLCVVVIAMTERAGMTIFPLCVVGE